MGLKAKKYFNVLWELIMSVENIPDERLLAFYENIRQQAEVRSPAVV
jgi:hypothetical protein